MGRGSQNQYLSASDLEAQTVRTKCEKATFFVYGALQNNAVLEALFQRIPPKEMALCLTPGIYGPYKIKDEDRPALSTVDVPFLKPSAEDRVILGIVRVLQ